MDETSVAKAIRESSWYESEQELRAELQSERLREMQSELRRGSRV